MERFVKAVNGRAKCCLLLETPESVAILEDIVAVPGIDMIHLGLNDMHLALGMKFMFELLANGSVDKWTNFIKEKVFRLDLVVLQLWMVVLYQDV